jgi:transposase-like protein
LELSQRDLKPLDIVSVFIDGKRFNKYGVVVALGVSTSGKKYVLGIFQADTENANACLELLNELERRGLPISGLLFIVDGGSGLNSALERKYNVSDEKKRTAVKLRCHLHKWNNIDDALDGKDERLKIEAKSLFWAMRDAKDRVESFAHATSLEAVLKRANVSALKSFQEAKEDLLKLHSLGLNSELRRVFSTTNPIESVNSITEEDMRRVKRWRDSTHFQRWYATIALHAEKRMRRVKGYKGLFSLKENLRQLCTHEVVDKKATAA